MFLIRTCVPKTAVYDVFYKSTKQKPCAQLSFSKQDFSVALVHLLHFELETSHFSRQNRQIPSRGVVVCLCDSLASQ